MKSLCFAIACLSGLGFTNGAIAQDPAYDSDKLKTLPRLSDAEWQELGSAGQQRSDGFEGTRQDDVTSTSQQGLTLIQASQSLTLESEVTAVFDYLVSQGQNEQGRVELRERYTFKIGPGNFDVTDYVIKRVE